MKNCPSPDELADLIETVELGIEKTKFGPVFMYNSGNLKEKQINQLNFGVFTIILQSLLRSVEFEGIKSDKG
jgi:hypothetical protein